MFMTNTTSSTRIVVAIDDSLQAVWAARLASQLAQQLSAHIMLVHVVEPCVPVDGDIVTTERIDQIRHDHGLAMLGKIRSSLPQDLSATCVQRTGLPAEEISNLARDWHANLIVVGTHGRGRLAKFVLGSTADALIRHSACPVISVAHEPKWIAADRRDPATADCDDSVAAHEHCSHAYASD